jgi:hypothetical protein
VLCAALIALPGAATAQSGLVGRVRYMGGYTHETPAVLGSAHDWWTGVVPEVGYLYTDDPRLLLRATYAFTAAVHTRNATEIGNRITVVSAYEISNRTRLLLSLDANQTSLSNYLITRPATDTPILVLPGSNSRLLTTAAGETLTWDASPSWVLGQTLEAVYVMSLDPDVELRNFFANAVLSADRTWQSDALGVELRTLYTSLEAPPLPQGQFVTITPAPRWRHDYTRELSSSLSGGPSLIISPDDDTRPLLAAYARAALLYNFEPSSLELSYVHSTIPSVLTGQLLRSHVVTLRAATALSEREQVFLGGSVGYLRGSVVDLRENPLPTNDIDAALADIDLTWQATSWLQLFARGLFSARDSSQAVEPFIREAAIIGLQLSTQAPDGVRIPLRSAQRVDRGDAPPPR